MKLPRYFADCAANNMDFIPMVVETFGAWGPAAAPVLNQISKAGASFKSLNPEFVAKNLYQSLSFTLQQFNARTLLKFISPSLSDR